jgi:hypothetical protein
MSPDITIERAKLSLIWIETNLDLLGDTGPCNVTLGDLGHRDSYAKLFNKVQTGDPVPLNLQLPWDNPQSQRFWKRYLNTQLTRLSGAPAFQLLVPFRLKLPFTVNASWLEKDVLLEAFFYPHGFALVATFETQISLTLKKFVELAFKMRKVDSLDITWENGTRDQLTLVQLSVKCMKYIRELALGPRSQPGNFDPNDPFTICTVIEGAVDDPITEITNKGEVHRALEAVTTWNDSLLRFWEKQLSLPELDDKVKLTHLSKSAGTFPSHVLYAQKRGRAVWFPMYFTYNQDPNNKLEKPRRLSCYHRNLVFASMQVESLAGLVQTTVQQMRKTSWTGLGLMQRDCATSAAEILGWMYEGDRASYRSMSSRYLIDQNEFTNDINNLRSQCGMKQLI